MAVGVCFMAAPALTSCSSDEDEPVRSEADIVGVWSDDAGHYMYLDSTIHSFNFDFNTSTEDEPFGFDIDGYYYEPGYNFLLYINAESQPDIYQVMSLTDTEMTWCWVDNLMEPQYDGLSKSEILGKVITQAQEGFEINPALYHTYERVPMAELEGRLAEFGYTLSDFTEGL